MWTRPSDVDRYNATD